MEARNEVPRAKSHIWRRDSELGIVIEYQIGGRLGHGCESSVVGWKMAQSRMENQYHEIIIVVLR